MEIYWVGQIVPSHRTNSPTESKLYNKQLKNLKIGQIVPQRVN